MGKIVFSWMIKKDSKIPGTMVRTSTIPEQLGRISYLLTDKTGEELAELKAVSFSRLLSRAPTQEWGFVEKIQSPQPLRCAGPSGVFDKLLENACNYGENVLNNLCSITFKKSEFL